MAGFHMMHYLWIKVGVIQMDAALQKRDLVKRFTLFLVSITLLKCGQAYSLPIYLFYEAGLDNELPSLLLYSLQSHLF